MDTGGAQGGAELTENGWIEEEVVHGCCHGYASGFAAGSDVAEDVEGHILWEEGGIAAMT